VLIQYIRSYPPYLEAVSSIRNLTTRHAVVTGDTLNMGFGVSGLPIKELRDVTYYCYNSKIQTIAMNLMSSLY
jgi:hypothetical protein